MKRLTIEFECGTLGFISYKYAQHLFQETAWVLFFTGCDSFQLKFIHLSILFVSSVFACIYFVCLCVYIRVHACASGCCFFLFSFLFLFEINLCKGV